MNEKIEVLKKLCIEQKPCFELDISTGTFVPSFFKGQRVYKDELNVEKFANLIIQECCSIIQDTPLPLRAECGDERLAFIEMITTYFGLEQ